MRVLVACEESQTVCKAFRARGHEAYSCDVRPCSGGHPEWHIQDDVLFHLNEGWDLMIAHPPCTYLSTVGNRWFDEQRYGEKAIDRRRQVEEAKRFFMMLLKAPIEKIAIENPKGFINSFLKPTQIIQPWYFGDPEQKLTCLWLRRLKRLNGDPTQRKPKPHYISAKGKNVTFNDNLFKTVKCKDELRRLRSKTFPGIANAMAEQWGGVMKACNQI